MPIILLPEADNAYVTIEAIRALPNLGDDNRFTDDDLAGAREWFETTFEHHVGMAFVPRTATERVHGSGRSTLRLKHWPVIEVVAVRIFSSATVSTAYTVTELADVVPAPGGLRRYSTHWPAGASNVEVDIIHGQQAPVPADIVRAAKVAIQEKLLEDNSGRPTDRTYGVASEGVFIRNILPGPDKPFGLASVDEVANRYKARYSHPGVG